MLLELQVLLQLGVRLLLAEQALEQLFDSGWFGIFEHLRVRKVTVVVRLQVGHGVHLVADQHRVHHLEARRAFALFEVTFADHPLIESCQDFVEPFLAQ